MMTKRSNLTAPSLTVAAGALRRLELDGEGDGSRLRLRWRRWSIRLLFKRSSNVWSKPKRSRDGDRLHHRVLLGYEHEEGDDADTDKRARGGSDTEREEKGEAASASAGWAGPFATRERG
jgi:hypothetical protein